jgi:hypothetical protein
VHHIVFRSQNGSDEEANLLTLCKTCHDGLHAGTITPKRTGKKRGTLLHATQMNSIRIQLLRRVQAEEMWGFVTKEHRLLWGLPKEHVFDATMIATRGNKPVFQTTRVVVKRCLPEGDGQQTKGKHSEQRITTGKIMGFRTFDKVRYQGQEYAHQGQNEHRPRDPHGYPWQHRRVETHSEVREDETSGRPFFLDDQFQRV